MISCEYIARQKLIVITLRGKVTLDESIELIKKVRETREVAPDSNVIVDSTDGIIALTSAQIKEMAIRSMPRLIKAEGRVKEAIIAPDDLNYGLSRMYAFHAEQCSPYSIRVFRGWGEALTWLGKDPSLAEAFRGAASGRDEETASSPGKPGAGPDTTVRDSFTLADAR